ncbi:MAG: ParB/RepB/Spo0J family partition protein [Phycisphaerales bacterium JB052]
MASAEKKTKKTKRARLGRGLGALIEQGNAPSVSIDLEQGHGSSEAVQNTNTKDAERAPKPEAMPKAMDDRQRVLEIAVGDIVPNPHQPRRVFDEQALETLAASIRTHGLMQPIVVRRSGETYELVAGERRWRAAKIAGLDTVRALLSEADDERSAELALIENILRADLNPIERAMGFAQLIDRFGMTQQQLADRMGMGRSAVANLIRLLELDPSLQVLVAQGDLSVGHAKVLLSCQNHDLRMKLAEECIAEGWTVRLLEQRINDAHVINQETQPAPNKVETSEQGRLHTVLRDMERRMSEQLGTRVTLKTNAQGSKGRVVIEFYDLDQFDGLLARMGVQGDELSA